jgi:hypothetical protein
MDCEDEAQNETREAYVLILSEPDFKFFIIPIYDFSSMFTQIQFELKDP